MPKGQKQDLARAQETYHRLNQKYGRDMRLLSCAGTLANLRDIIKDYDRLGDSVWDIFNASKGLGCITKRE
jgi:hypothetical protein